MRKINTLIQGQHNLFREKYIPLDEERWKNFISAIPDKPTDFDKWVFQNFEVSDIGGSLQIQIQDNIRTIQFTANTYNPTSNTIIFLRTTIQQNMNHIDIPNVRLLPQYPITQDDLIYYGLADKNKLPKMNGSVFWEIQEQPEESPDHELPSE